MIDETAADDLNAEASTAETEAPEAAAPTQAETVASPEAGKPAGEGEAKAGDGKAAKTLVAGADPAGEAKAADDKAAAAKAETQNWREELAKHYAAGDKKLEAKELKRLERITDQKAIWGMYRELEAKFTSGGLVKIPGKDAKPEEVAAFHKSMGVPEKPDGYLEHIKLENGAVIGDADKPLLGTFTEALHKAGASPAAVNAAANWYYKNQEEAAAKLDEEDEAFRQASDRALKEKYGPATKRLSNATVSLFATAPGGTDTKNPNALISRLLAGRTADGKLIGNDPEVMDWLIGMAQEVNPVATVVEDGAPSAMSLDNELADIQKLRQSDPKRYWSDTVQARELELLTAKSKIQAR